MAGYFEERAEILTEADDINMNLALTEKYKLFIKILNQTSGLVSIAYLYIWFLSSNFNIICITIIVLYLLCNLRYYRFFFNTIYNTFSILYCQIKVCFDKKKTLFCWGG